MANPTSVDILLARITRLEARVASLEEHARVVYANTLALSDLMGSDLAKRKP